MKQLLLTISIALITATGWSQCDADFVDTLATWTSNPYDVHFVNTSTGYNTSGTYFYWTFSSTASPNFSTSPDTVTVTFPGPGTYWAYLELGDSVNFCEDSIWSSVIIPGTTLSGSITPSNATCGNCNGSISLSVTGGTAPYSYLWSNGDTTQNLTGLCAGNYSVTIADAFNATITDSATIVGIGGVSLNTSVSTANPCPGDSVVISASASGGTAPYSFAWSNGSTNSSIGVYTSNTYTVTATDANGCADIDTVSVSFNSGFSVSASSTNETCISCCDGTASVSVSGGSGSFSYSWNTGATSSSINTLCPGTYTVIVEDTISGCTSTASVVISAFTCYSISGDISQGMNTRVYLIQESSGFLTAVDSVATDSNGSYEFNGVCNGTYYVKGALLPTHSMYSNYVPTYYDSAALWSAANSLVINSASLSNVDFSLLSGTNSGGPGFVGGAISQGANRSGDPVPGVQVLLMNENEELVAFTTTNANGEYSFDGLAYGNYLIHTDILNKTSFPLEITLDENNERLENGNFLVFGPYVKPELPTAVEEVAGASSKVFPNPAVDHITIQSDEVIDHIAVYSIIGELMMEVAGQDNVVELSLNELGAGQYLIEVKGSSHLEHHLIVIK